MENATKIYHIPLWKMICRQWMNLVDRYEFDKAFGYMACLDEKSADAKMRAAFSANILGDDLVIPEDGHDFIPKIIVIPDSIIPAGIQLSCFLNKRYEEALRVRNGISKVTLLSQEEYPYIISNVELGYSSKGFSKKIVSTIIENSNRRMLHFEEVLAIIMQRPSVLNDHGLLAGMSHWEGNIPGIIRDDNETSITSVSEQGGEEWGIPTCDI